MTRNGKIARLPKGVRDQLNQRLENGEQGKGLVEWLNSLPEVEAVITREFGCKAVTEQNLSEWKKGGYRDWQINQERRDLVRQLEEEGGELGAVMNPGRINRHFSVVLTAELARAAREVMEQVADPEERAQCLGEFVGKFAQLRREESHASRVELIRERWEREVAREEQDTGGFSALMPLNASLMQWIYMQMFGRSEGRDFNSAGLLAAGFGTRSPSLNPTESE